MRRLEQIKKENELLLKKIVSERICQIVENVYRDTKIGQGLKDRIESLRRDREGYIYISYLRSSFITRSNEFEILFCNGQPFVEENDESFYYSLNLLFGDIETDLKMLEFQLKKGFIRITSGEIEEIRRLYMEWLFKDCKYVFIAMLKGWEQKKIKVYYGEYMGEFENIALE